MNSFQPLPHPLPAPPPDPLVSAMEQAAGSGDVAGVQRALAGSDSEGARHRLVKRGLLHAARNDQAATFRHLIEQGVPLSDDEHRMYAAPALASHRLAIPEILYAQGWRPGSAALYDAQSDAESLSWLIAHGARPTSDGPLMHAAGQGSTRAVDILLAAGSDVPSSIALHTAAQYGASRADSGIAMMEHLIARGFDVNAADTALLRVKNGRGTDGRQGPPLRWACAAGNVEGARWLLEHGADQPLKGCSDDYWDYMMSACTREDASELRELLSRYR